MRRNRQQLTSETTSERPTIAQLEAAVKKARRVWINDARSDADLLKVEARYRALIRLINDAGNDSEDDVSAEECHCLVDDCRRRLAMLYLQRGNLGGARCVLKRLGCVARLSSEVLNYDTHRAPFLSEPALGATSAGEALCPCSFVDNVVREPKTLAALQRVFGPIDSCYWTSNNYSVEPPSPYFSYVRALQTQQDAASSSPSCCVIDTFIESVRSAAALRHPELAEARAVEMWSHNRPHASAHQLHFDADDEGRGGVRKPIATVVYVVEGSSNPTLVTSQRLGDQQLARNGWLCFPQPNRCFFFDSEFLHGVVGGKGVGPAPGCRRVTLMLAFWREIKVRPGEGPGSARPFPTSPTESEWAKELLAPVPRTDLARSPDELRKPPMLSHVFERVEDDAPWPKSAPIPAYEQVFGT